MRIMWQIIKHTIKQVRRDQTFRILLWSFFFGLVVVIMLSFLVLNQQEYVFMTFVISLVEVLVFLRILFAVSKRYTTHKDKKFFTLYHIHWISPSQIYAATTGGYLLIVWWMYAVIGVTTSIVAAILGIFTLPLIIAMLASMLKMVVMLITMLVLSVIVRPLLAIVWTVIMYVLAHSTWFIYQLTETTQSYAMSILYKGLYIVLPPLDYLSYVDQYLQNTVLSFSVVMHIVFYITIIWMIWYSILKKKFI